MKFATLFLLSFLCAKCFVGDCGDGGDFICENRLPVAPEASAAIPYTDGETIPLRFEDDPVLYFVDLQRVETSAASQSCQDIVLVRGGISSSARLFDVFIATDRSGEKKLDLTFFADIRSSESVELSVSFGLDDEGLPEAVSPYSLRLIRDTVMAGIALSEVALITAPIDTLPGTLRAVYYSREVGFLRLERCQQSAIYRSE